MSERSRFKVEPVTSSPNLMILETPEAQRPPEAPTSVPRPWMMFALFAAAFVVWSWIQRGAITRSTAALAADSLAFLPLNAGAVYWLWRASRNVTCSDGERSGLRLLAAMYVFTALGNCTWAFDEMVRRFDPWYGMANIFYVVSYTVGIVALSRFPIAPRGALELRKFLIDLACIVLSMAVLTWTFVGAPVEWRAVSTSHQVVEIVYPLLCIVLIALLCRLLMRPVSTQRHGDFAVLAVAIFVQCVVDLILQLDYRNEVSQLTTWAVAICPATYVVIVYGAARTARRTYVVEERAPEPSLNPVNLLPTIAAVAVYAVLIWAAQSDNRQPLGPLVAAAIALNILFLAKQMIAVRENASLVASRAEEASRARYADQLREGQRLEAIGRLAGGIAHDFNNLLTTVLANAEFAMTRMRPGDLSHEEISDIRSAAMRGADLVRQLLAFSRKSVIAPVRLQPDAVLRDMSRLLERLAGDRCRLQLDISADVGHVLMDRGQLEQVMANLITNARDAMPDGGTIVLSGRSVTLDAAAASALAVTAGAYVALAVQDSGVGMSVDVRAHIFEPFFSTKARGKGTGLGLASAYGIIRQSDGAIDVVSEPGRGSRFTLYLPRVAAADAVTAVATPDAGEATMRRHGETVLLVEDEASVRQVTRRMLLSEGYTVLTASDAVGARALFDTHGDDISLMISDVMMPGETGTALAAHLRERWPELPVIYVSGYTSSELPDDSGDVGDDFILKPFTGAQLLARVDARLRAPDRALPTSVRSR